MGDLRLRDLRLVDLRDFERRLPPPFGVERRAVKYFLPGMGFVFAAAGVGVVNAGGKICGRVERTPLRIRLPFM
jgi:hypothetical protein